MWRGQTLANTGLLLTCSCNSVCCALQTKLRRNTSQTTTDTRGRLTPASRMARHYLQCGICSSHEWHSYSTNPKHQHTVYGTADKTVFASMSTKWGVVTVETGVNVSTLYAFFQVLSNARAVTTWTCFSPSTMYHGPAQRRVSPNGQPWWDSVDRGVPSKPAHQPILSGVDPTGAFILSSEEGRPSPIITATTNVIATASLLSVKDGAWRSVTVSTPSTADPTV